MPYRGIIRGKAEEEVEWIIDGFSSLLDGKYYQSPSFDFAGESWGLDVNTYPLARSRDRLITLCLYRFSVGPHLNVEYTVSLKMRGGSQYGETGRTREFGDWGGTTVILIVLEHRRKSEWLSVDRLTIGCRLRRIHQTKGDAGKDCDCGSTSLLRKNKLNRDLKDMFLQKEECDVVIRVQGKEFPAHRNILMARSPVFASAFRSDMKEKANGVIDIEDCDPSSFSDFLCYLYCGDVENLSSENVFGLFTAADKYDVQDLRSECLEFMKKNLSVETFCDTIALALRHSESELIDLTTDFFKKNAYQIIVTLKWQQFAADNPTLSNELFIKLLVPSENSSS